MVIICIVLIIILMSICSHWNKVIVAVQMYNGTEGWGFADYTDDGVRHDLCRHNQNECWKIECIVLVNNNVFITYL